MSRVDLSPRAVSERLRRASELSNLETSKRLETKIDLSPAAVSRRLEQVSKLRSFCLSLRQVKE